MSTPGKQDCFHCMTVASFRVTFHFLAMPLVKCKRSHQGSDNDFIQPPCPLTGAEFKELRKSKMSIQSNKRTASESRQKASKVEAPIYSKALYESPFTLSYSPSVGNA